VIPTGKLVADTFHATPEKIGLTITDAADVGTLTGIDAAPVAVADTSPDCATPGANRDHVQRRFVDLLVVGFPARLHIRLPRFTCTNSACGRQIF
jgi:transposase